MHDPIAHPHALETFDDAVELACCLADGMEPPAPACVVVLDDRRRPTGSVLVVDCDDALVPLLELAATVVGPVAPLTFLVVSMHDGGSACDPDDVFEWEEAHGAVAAAGAELLDWLVVTERSVFSKARHAPTPGLVRW
ncbi:MAG: hypothetical protein ACOYNI_03685 [Acidimicrobiia bacterium]